MRSLDLPAPTALLALSTFHEHQKTTCMERNAVGCHGQGHAFHMGMEAWRSGIDFGSW